MNAGGERRNAAPAAAAHALKVVEACRRLERADEIPPLAELARAAGLSAWHFHRLFMATTGVTPAEYAAAQRTRRVRDQLPASQSKSVTDAIYASGFNSSGRFYEHANAMLGMTPTAYRAGGAHTTIRFAIGRCTLGAILVAATDRGVCAILLGDDAAELLRAFQDRFPRANLIGGDAAFERLVALVVGFVETPAFGLDLPLDVRGTAFQQRVWRALRAIPAGTTVSYAEVARRIGAPRAVRAVARAIASNPIAVAIPCHRVVASDGALTGYRWGIARKRALLEREAGPPSIPGRRLRRRDVQP
jgi:AraC family transcriptional regulator of adaptative response/methylated-DNA-[protein]-cysteine methyltransferase